MAMPLVMAPVVTPTNKATPIEPQPSGLAAAAAGALTLAAMRAKTAALSRIRRADVTGTPARPR
jgi:hypothetical protein